MKNLLPGGTMVDRGVRIGLAGPSCSGKSTVARILADRLGARHLNLDTYYAKGHDRRFVEVEGELVRSFEHPDAYDGAALLSDMLAHPGPVVAEGFLLLGYPGAADAFDLRFFVGLPWDETMRRRAGRTGQTTSKVDRSFDLIGRSEWMAYGAGQESLPGVAALDGMRPPEALAEEVLGRVAAWSSGLAVA